MKAAFNDSLPRPETGKLQIYLLGPGVGESQVVIFPDGRCLVVDGCTHAGVNLPAALLEHLGIPSIDALVLTHPDLDHVRGVAEIVRRFKPQKLFRYPGLGYVRDLVVAWHKAQPAKARYRELHEAIGVIREHPDSNEPSASTRPWTPQGAAYTVHFLAPTHDDQERVRLLFEKIVEHRSGRYVLSPRFERLMSFAGAGSTPRPGRLTSVPLALTRAVTPSWRPCVFI